MSARREMITHPDAGAILDIDPQEISQFVERCLQEHGRILAEQREDVRKDAPETAVTIVNIPGHPAVCVKEFRTRGRLHALKGLFRRTQGRRTFVNGSKLLDAGVGAALPLALVRDRWFGAVETEWVVMEHLADSVELDRYLAKRIEAEWSTDERRSLALALGRFIGTLHGRGIYHADLKTCNVLVYDGAEKERGRESPSRRARFSLLDYDDVSFSALVNDRRKVKNLTQLFLSTPIAVRAADRLRFLREYALHAGTNRKDRKVMARRVLRQAAGRPILYVGLQGDVVEEWERGA